MIITVTRYRKKAETIDGRLTIDGSLRLCDTAENALHALPAGMYRVSIIKCKQHSRKMPVILIKGEDLEGGAANAKGNIPSPSPKCDCCKKLDFVSNNTSLPLYCPMLKPGNGVYHREDGSIIVGEYIAPGCLKHPKAAFDTVYDRIRKSAERGHELLLEIVEAYPVEKKVPHTLYEKCEDWLQRIDNTPKLQPAPTV